jgi:hypothetical protein
MNTAVAFCAASAEYAQAMLSGSGRHSATMMIVWRRVMAISALIQLGQIVSRR